MFRALRNIRRLLEIARTLARHDALFSLERLEVAPFAVATRVECEAWMVRDEVVARPALVDELRLAAAQVHRSRLFGALALLVAVRVGEGAAEEGESATRVVMKFPSWLAPVKVAILPLSKKEELAKVAKPLYEELSKNFVCEYDETQSIGKRYRRQDEIGTPFCVTIDFDTPSDNSVTVRDRDTMKQERVEIAKLNGYFVEKLS